MLRTRSRRRGGTLVELLISMVILGVLGTLVARIMMDQQRSFQRMTEQTVVRRELRSAMSLLPTELRGVSSVGGDITAFDNMSITFRATLGSSVVCARTATTVDLPPVGAARMALTSWATTPSVGDVVSILRPDSSGQKGDFWSAHTVTTVSVLAAPCSGTVYVHPTADIGKSGFRLTVTPALPDSVLAGSALRLVRSTRYALTQVASGRWYLGRSEFVSGAWSAAIPVSGPYQPASASGTGGLSVALYDTLGAKITTLASAPNAARLDIVLRGRGRSSSRVAGSSITAIEDTVAVRVALRNRR